MNRNNATWTYTSEGVTWGFGDDSVTWSVNGGDGLTWG